MWIYVCVYISVCMHAYEHPGECGCMCMCVHMRVYSCVCVFAIFSSSQQKIQ